jgi:putative salt-induced outer membrane protein YdiY
MHAAQRLRGRPQEGRHDAAPCFVSDARLVLLGLGILLASAASSSLPVEARVTPLAHPDEPPVEEQTPEERPDRVLLLDGDRISGRLVTMLDGVLVLETPYSPRLELAFAEVATISTVRPVRLVLDDAEEITARLRGAAAGEVLVEAEGEPAVALPLARILAIEPLPPPPAVRYQGSLGMAGTFQRGNTWHTALSADARGERRGPRGRLELRFRWQDAQEERARISRSTFGATKYEHSLSSGLYLFAGGEALSDSHRDLRLRSIVSLGAGYEILESEVAELAVEAGASYLRRDFIAARDQEELAVRLAGRVRWLLFGRLELRDQLILYPSFEEGGVQLRNELEIASALFGRWGLKASWVLDFDPQAPAGIEELDHHLLVGLQYSYR